MSLDGRGRLAAVNCCVQRRCKIPLLEVRALAGHLLKNTFNRFLGAIASRPLQCLAVVRGSRHEILLRRLWVQKFLQLLLALEGGFPPPLVTSKILLTGFGELLLLLLLPVMLLALPRI